MDKKDDSKVSFDEQKEEFISLVAHEFRAPLTAIKGYLSMILEGDAGNVSDKARGYVADAMAVNERLVRLVNNMLNVSRIEKGKLAFQMENINLSRLARGALDNFRAEVDRKGLSISIDVPSHIEDLIYVDVDKVNEIVANLVSNAVKYTDSGFIKIKVENPKEDWVRLSVVDSGPGISKEEQKLLFRKFYRVESTAGKTVGSGLGLYICKLLVEKFEGKIGVDSDIDKGSTFWFEIPLSKHKKSE